MFTHILEKHTTPDKDNNFSCEECDFSCRDKYKLGTHFRADHMSVGQESEQSKSTDDPIELKRELRQLKNNFERLDSLFQDSLEEANQVRSEYQAKLIEANDRFREVKAENEELREKVDILFKLGRSYITKNENKNPTVDAPTDATVEPEKNENIASTDDNIDDLQGWTKTKLRGFKRVTPSSHPEPVKEKPAPSVPKRGTQSNDNTGRRVPPPSVPATIPASPSPHHGQESQNYERKQYCHHYVNQGRCIFEEKTGDKCRFLHEEAPMCRSGFNCNRSRCMYKHPNVGGNTGGNTGFLDRMTNPWPMMNPWLNQTPFQQFPTQWNMAGNRSRQ